MRHIRLNVSSPLARRLAKNFLQSTALGMVSLSVLSCGVHSYTFQSPIKSNEKPKAVQNVDVADRRVPQLNPQAGRAKPTSQFKGPIPYFGVVPSANSSVNSAAPLGMQPAGIPSSFASPAMPGSAMGGGSPFNTKPKGLTDSNMGGMDGMGVGSSAFPSGSSPYDTIGQSSYPAPNYANPGLQGSGTGAYPSSPSQSPFPSNGNNTDMNGSSAFASPYGAGGTYPLEGVPGGSSSINSGKSDNAPIPLMPSMGAAGASSAGTSSMFPPADGGYNGGSQSMMNSAPPFSGSTGYPMDAQSPFGAAPGMSPTGQGNPAAMGQMSNDFNPYGAGTGSMGGASLSNSGIQPDNMAYPASPMSASSSGADYGNTSGPSYGKNAVSRSAAKEPEQSWVGKTWNKVWPWGSHDSGASAMPGSQQKPPMPPMPGYGATNANAPWSADSSGLQSGGQGAGMMSPYSAQGGMFQQPPMGDPMGQPLAPQGMMAPSTYPSGTGSYAEPTGPEPYTPLLSGGYPTLNSVPPKPNFGSPQLGQVNMMAKELEQDRQNAMQQQQLLQQGYYPAQQQPSQPLQAPANQSGKSTSQQFNQSNQGSGGSAYSPNYQADPSAQFPNHSNSQPYTGLMRSLEPMAPPENYPLPGREPSLSQMVDGNVKPAVASASQAKSQPQAQPQQASAKQTQAPVQYQSQYQAQVQQPSNQQPQAQIQQPLQQIQAQGAQPWQPSAVNAPQQPVPYVPSASYLVTPQQEQNLAEALAKYSQEMDGKQAQPQQAQAQQIQQPQQPQQSKQAQSGSQFQMQYQPQPQVRQQPQVIQAQAKTNMEPLASSPQAQARANAPSVSQLEPSAPPVNYPYGQNVQGQSSYTNSGGQPNNYPAAQPMMQYNGQQAPASQGFAPSRYGNNETYYQPSRYGTSISGN
ncbi:MAG: hypothetical protein IPP74_01305 [Alphaproteobacteria bacterium]|nr:hypothetical protein [Alphaproteobacteria bacterium]